MLNTILVALDSSELSKQVILTLRQFSLPAETLVILTHVIAPSELGSGLDLPADRPGSDPQLGLYRHIEVELETIQASLPCRSQIEIVSGDPAEEIIRLANIHKTDLIVLGSRGLTGVNRILKGSVSSQVVSDAHCSVLVVKQFP
jgi:nucleotide-binding universal stress UspA family protein